MIGFSFDETVFSVLCAVIFGIGFCFFYTVNSIIFLSLKNMPKIFLEIIVFDKVFPSPSIKIGIKEGKTGGIYAFFSVVAFFIGYMLLCYFTLDGEIRLYMLVISSASFFLFYSAFCDISKTIFIFVFDLALCLISTVVRLMILPFKKGLYIINNKNTRN